MDLIGNQKIRDNLDKIVQNNQISHSYLFVGTNGIGKKLFAKEFAKSILCLNESKKPCMQCKSCLEFENGNHPDYYEIAAEENSIKIDTIRQMQRKVQELPIVSSRKVYVIDDSESMTKEAQNCLLKTLEEPPSFVTIILITSDENKILSTIQSRCLKINFHALSKRELKQYLQKKYGAEEFTDSMIAACQGSIGKAEEIYQNKEMYTLLNQIFNSIETKSITEVLPQLEVVYKNKENIQNILEYLNAMFMEKAKDKIQYVDYIKYVEEAKRDLIMNANFDMTMDRLFFRIWGD